MILDAVGEGMGVEIGDGVVCEMEGGDGGRNRTKIPTLMVTTVVIPATIHRIRCHFMEISSLHMRTLEFGTLHDSLNRFERVLLLNSKIGAKTFA